MSQQSNHFAYESSVLQNPLKCPLKGSGGRDKDLQSKLSS